MINTQSLAKHVFHPTLFHLPSTPQCWQYEAVKALNLKARRLMVIAGTVHHFVLHACIMVSFIQNLSDLHAGIL